MKKYAIGESRVIESREVGDGITIRRRRETPDGKRFTTYERIEKPNLAVIKKDGVRELFDRDKLATAIKRSVGKFFSSEVIVEEMISKIEDDIYAVSENEVTSKQIGDIVLDELAMRNEVAYVRFASVYHKFKTLDDFVKILEERRGKKLKSKNKT
ncbi:MAG TPA: transcriptional regulator NrdR [Candidatus Saccharibacteria bacterium]|nr:transcriptional regulator NrdR [Candidatus Saccharibacteria bacterium]